MVWSLSPEKCKPVGRTFMRTIPNPPSRPALVARRRVWMAFDKSIHHHSGQIKTQIPPRNRVQKL